MLFQLVLGFVALFKRVGVVLGVLVGKLWVLGVLLLIGLGFGDLRVIKGEFLLELFPLALNLLLIGRVEGIKRRRRVPGRCRLPAPGRHLQTPADCTLVRPSNPPVQSLH